MKYEQRLLRNEQHQQSLGEKQATFFLARAVLVACVFRVMLGGGAFSRPPLTRSLGPVATRGKRQSKKCQK